MNNLLVKDKGEFWLKNKKIKKFSQNKTKLTLNVQDYK